MEMFLFFIIHAVRQLVTFVVKAAPSLCSVLSFTTLNLDELHGCVFFVKKTSETRHRKAMNLRAVKINK